MIHRRATNDRRRADERGTRHVKSPYKKENTSLAREIKGREEEEDAITNSRKKGILRSPVCTIKNLPMEITYDVVKRKGEDIVRAGGSGARGK